MEKSSMWDVGWTMWIQLRRKLGHQKKRKESGIQPSGYQFQSSSSSSFLLWTEADGDMVSSFIKTPNPPVWPCRSPSSSSSEVFTADISGMGFSVCVGDTEATNGFVDTEAPLTSDGVGEDHAFSRDWDISASNTDARFWFFAKLRCSGV